MTKLKTASNFIYPFDDPDYVNALAELDREFPGVEIDESLENYISSRNIKKHFKPLLSSRNIKKHFKPLLFFIPSAFIISFVYFFVNTKFKPDFELRSLLVIIFTVLNAVVMFSIASIFLYARKIFHE